MFGSKQTDKPDVTVELPVRHAELKGIALLKLTEVLQREYRGTLESRIQDRREVRSGTGSMIEEALVDQIKVQYCFELEYGIFDEKLLRDMIGNTDPEADLNELFYVSLTEFNSITVSVIEGDSADYAEAVLELFNEACKDWGIRGKRLVVKSIVPVEEYRDFYEAYKRVWG